MNKKKIIENQVEETPVVTSEANTEQPKQTETTNTEQLDGFDIKSFFVEAQTIPIQQEQAEIPVRKPKRQQWFRIHPSLEKDVYLLDLEEENNFYLLQPNIIQFITTKVQKYRLYLGMVHQGGLFFFPTILQRLVHKRSERKKEVIPTVLP